MKKVLFIANIGLEKKVKPNGVNVKNKHILKYLNNKNNIDLKIIDTYNWKNKIFKLFYQISFYSFKYDKIILSINPDSANYIIKYLDMFNLSKKLIYFVVGGNLNKKIRDKEYNKSNYYNLKKIFVQTFEMKDDLESLGLDNIQRLANSKYFDRDFDNYIEIKDPIKCFYLGRIHPDKGINIIFEALNKINTIDKMKFEVNFYGPIADDFKDEFLEKINEFKYTEYKGIIDLINNKNNYKKLSNYNLFLFPTYWHGEGFPGVVIDSFISGVPVLASDWNHNEEVIENNKNGIIFQSQNLEDFIKKLNYIYSNKNELIRLSENAYKSADDYHSKNILKVLDDLM